MCSDLDLGLDDDNMYCLDGEIALDGFLTRFPEWRDSDIEWGTLLESIRFPRWVDSMVAARPVVVVSAHRLDIDS
jgi:hypothetical protein